MVEPYIVGYTILKGVYVRVVLKVHRKGIIVLPKRLREALGVDEGDEVIAEVVEEKLILRALRPRIIDTDSKIVKKTLHEEYDIERNR